MKTKTTTLAGTAMAAIFAAGFVVSAQAATSAKSNAKEKEITRQLNESQMQHPGVVNNQRAGNTQLSQNDTGTSSEDMNGVNGTSDQNNQNTGYSPNGNSNCQFNESTATGPNEQTNGANCENQNTGYTPGADTNDEGTGTTNENDQNYTPGANDQGTGNMHEDRNNPSNTGYTPGASDQDNGATENENNPQNTGYSGEDEDNPGAEDMHENGNAQMHENEGVQSNGAPLSEEEMRGAVSLSDVPNANAELQSVQIETRSGERIGTVQSVEFNADGTARAIDANVEGRHVSLDPNNLVYLKDHNALVTDLTKPQIENLPPVSKSY